MENEKQTNDFSLEGEHEDLTTEQPVAQEFSSEDHSATDDMTRRLVTKNIGINDIEDPGSRILNKIRDMALTTPITAADDHHAEHFVGANVFLGAGRFGSHQGDASQRTHYRHRQGGIAKELSS